MGYQPRTSRHVRVEFVVILCLSGFPPGILRNSFLISSKTIISKFPLDLESKSLVKQSRFIYFKVISCGKTKFIAWSCYTLLLYFFNSPSSIISSIYSPQYAHIKQELYLQSPQPFIAIKDTLGQALELVVTQVPTTQQNCQLTS